MNMAGKLVAVGTALVLVWATGGIGFAPAFAQSAKPDPASSSWAASANAETSRAEADDPVADGGSDGAPEGAAGTVDPKEHLDAESPHEEFVPDPSGSSSAESDAGEADGEDAETTDEKPLKEGILAVLALVQGDGLSSAASIERSGSTVYANGVPIVVKPDADGKAYIFDGAGTVKLDETPLASGSKVYGGGNGMDIDGNTSISVEAVSNISIFGGGYNGAVSGNARISVANASTGTVYGGGFSDGSRAADIGGSVFIDLAGTGTKSKVYGGGSAEASKGDASANVAGAVRISCENFNHQGGSSVYGGGYARTSSAHSASAQVGSVQMEGSGPTYVLRGGGWAFASGSGAAHADVLGAIEIVLTDPDVREVYSGGYADGAAATADAASVDTTVAGGEMMMLYGGGTADGGSANVAGAANVTIDGCSNLYGYTIGGGSASNAGSADVGSVAISIHDSVGPVEKQLGSWVAQAVYVGGSASGAGSHADVTGSASLAIEGGSMAGNLYGGGDASGGASATVKSLSVRLSNIAAYMFNDGNQDVAGLLSLFAAGETVEDGSSSLVQDAVDVQLSGLNLENLWGAVSAVDDDPFAPTAQVGASFQEGAGLTALLACVDRIELSHELVVPAFQPKGNGVPTMIRASNFAVGDALVTCPAPDAHADWFALDDREIGFEQREQSARWLFSRASGSIVVDPEADAGEVPEVALADPDGALSSLLTEEDQAALDGGSSVTFALKVAPHDLSSDEQSLLAEIARLASYTFVQHLDISLAKQVDGVETPLSTLSTPLRLTIATPDEAADAQTPTKYAVVRVHENPDGTLKTAVLEDKDDDPATITIETDAFSTYSLAYAVEGSGGTTDPGGNGGGSGDDGSNGGEGQGGSPDGGGTGGVDGQTGSRGQNSADDPLGDGANASATGGKDSAGSLLATSDPTAVFALAAAGVILIAACTVGAAAVRRSRRS